RPTPQGVSRSAGADLRVCDRGTDSRQTHPALKRNGFSWSIPPLRSRARKTRKGPKPLSSSPTVPIRNLGRSNAAGTRTNKKTDDEAELAAIEIDSILQARLVGS